MDDADTMRCTAGCEITHTLPPVQDMQDSWKSANDRESSADQLAELKVLLSNEGRLARSLFSVNMVRPCTDRREGGHTLENCWKMITE